jgi:SAM-dependent methyltransferase
MADLPQVINSHVAHQLIDEESREAALRATRMLNFNELLKCIKLLKPRGARLLDVGCAHGWFLDMARNYYQVLGLEPDKSIFESVSHQGLPIRNGYFPNALYLDEGFDIIVFNDVFEHIQNIKETLLSCHNHLNADGLLVLNLPSSNGLFYKWSKIFNKFGFPQFFERMWQKDLPSPHLHYFNLYNLVKFLESNGFDVKFKGRLSTLQFSGLYSRVSYAGRMNGMAQIFIYICLILVLPILRVFPSDIIYVVSVRK